MDRLLLLLLPVLQAGRRRGERTRAGLRDLERLLPRLTFLPAGRRRASGERDAAALGATVRAPGELKSRFGLVGADIEAAAAIIAIEIGGIYSLPSCAAPGFIAPFVTPGCVPSKQQREPEHILYCGYTAFGLRETVQQRDESLLVTFPGVPGARRRFRYASFAGLIVASSADRTGGD